ncbi:MAG: hypothetical protein AAFU85_25585 [Planctomycetota bacterium]
MKTNQPPELLAIAESKDAEDSVRRRLCRERCQAMEERLRDIGFAPGTSYWSVALLVARVSDGWQPLVRTLDKLASDKALETKSTDIRSRRRIVRRAIAELEEWDLLSVDRSEGPKRRATRAEVVYTITLNRPVIVGEIEPRDADNCPDNGADKRPDNGADNTPDRPRTNPGQIESDSLYPPFTLDPFGPLSPLGRSETSDVGGTEDHECLVKAEQLEPIVVNIARALRWPGGDYETAWRVAAAFHAGDVNEADIAIACRLASENARKSPMGYFRTKLAERLGKDPSEMRELLSRHRCAGGFPNRRPSKPVPRPVSVQRCPSGGIDFNERRNELVRKFEELV